MATARHVDGDRGRGIAVVETEGTSVVMLIVGGCGLSALLGHGNALTRRVLPSSFIVPDPMKSSLPVEALPSDQFAPSLT